jgi:hypothetical protein
VKGRWSVNAHYVMMKNHHPLFRAASRQFGTWSGALRMVGFGNIVSLNNGMARRTLLKSAAAGVRAWRNTSQA